MSNHPMTNPQATQASAIDQRLTDLEIKATYTEDLVEQLDKISGLTTSAAYKTPIAFKPISVAEYSWPSRFAKTRCVASLHCIIDASLSRG